MGQVREAEEKRNQKTPNSHFSRAGLKREEGGIKVRKKENAKEGGVVQLLPPGRGEGRRREVAVPRPKCGGGSWRNEPRGRRKVPKKKGGKACSSAV